MKRNRSFAGSLGSGETIGGFCYLVFLLLFLPGILSWLNTQLTAPLNQAELNFVFYLINFIAILLIFHSFLGRGLNQVAQHPALFCQAAVLGLAAYYACTWAFSRIAAYLMPGFTNYNDAAIAEMLKGNFFLMAVGTVILVPPVEECLYRGLIFRNLYGKSRWAAYIVSILAFSVIHIIGYIGTYTPVQLLMAFVQYLPAGLCLAWCYTKADTIFTPIVVHAVINAISIGIVR